MTRQTLFRVLLIIASSLSSAAAMAASLVAIDTSQFNDGAHHWRRLRDENRVIQPEPDQPGYRPEQVREIADNILLFQRANGGWPKDYDMLAVLTDSQRKQLAATKSRDDTSFDNHNTFSQVEYLARAFTATQEPKYRDACSHGIDYMLAAQYPNGGFPQRYPKSDGYHAHITFNDGAMMGVLRVLKDAAIHKPHFSWLDDNRRRRANEAVQRGIDCILKCQIRVDGKLTGWCQQHDKDTFAPASARTFELASICPGDTTEIVRFLMSVDSPSPEIVQAVDAAVAWMKQVPIADVVIKQVPAPKEKFARYTASFDRVVEPSPGAKPIWARHYEVGTNRPIFAGRDGIKKYQFADIERERRTGTAWFGYWPEQLLAGDHARWRQKIAPGRN